MRACVRCVCVKSVKVCVPVVCRRVENVAVWVGWVHCLRACPCACVCVRVCVCFQKVRCPAEVFQRRMEISNKGAHRALRTRPRTPLGAQRDRAGVSYEPTDPMKGFFHLDISFS